MQDKKYQVEPNLVFSFSSKLNRKTAISLNKIQHPSSWYFFSKLGTLQNFFSKKISHLITF